MEREEGVRWGGLHVSLSECWMWRKQTNIPTIVESTASIQNSMLWCGCEWMNRTVYLDEYSDMKWEKKMETTKKKKRTRWLNTPQFGDKIKQKRAYSLCLPSTPAHHSYKKKHNLWMGAKSLPALLRDRGKQNHCPLKNAPSYPPPKRKYISYGGEM